MKTGIKPLDGADFDIDIMLLFNISCEKDGDISPTKIKKMVYEALDFRPNRTVEYRKPCVRVQYYTNGSPDFHVDLAIYSDKNESGKTYLSKGKPSSLDSEKKWELSNPLALKNLITNWGENQEERAQMRRVIRYLKRWKDLKFTGETNGKPTGIAITALALEKFSPVVNYSTFSSSYNPDDLLALRRFVENIIETFSIWDNSISVKLPVEPYNDLFEKFAEKKFQNFKEKLLTLKENLVKTENEIDPVKASRYLIEIFGSDFPEAKKEESSQVRSLAFPGKTDSA